jgi:hypothetical protein
MNVRLSFVLTVGAAVGMMLPALADARREVKSDLSSEDVKLAATN